MTEASGRASAAAAVAKLWTPLIGLLLLGLWALRPLGVDPARSFVTEFDTARAIGRLEAILGDQRPHPVDSDASDAVLARLLGQIRRLGFTPLVREQFHCNGIRAGAAICARPRNVAFWVTAPGDDAVMVTAHHDSVPSGPGAADDGMGVAVALEVAHLLKGKTLGRPVMVLLTDGEEAGLVGAAQFAANDPLAKQVGSVVNVEARGTTGSANLFQTSSPNGADVAALARGGLVPSGNSLVASVHEWMPNDTDLTMLLPMGVDAANFAVIGGGKRYHTALDDLAHLDPASVRHMGASALAATLGFASAPAKEPDGHRIFTNLDRMFFLTLASGMAALSLAIGLISAIILFVRTRDGHPWRAALTPPLALVAGTGLAIVVAAIIAQLRPETAFGTAYPAAARLAYATAALTGAYAVVYRLRSASAPRLAAAAWIWLTGPICAAFLVVPGLSTLVAASLMVVPLAAAASFFARLRPLEPYLLIAAATVFAIVTLPLAGGLEDAVFVEYAAPATLLLVFLILFFLPGGDAPRRLAMRASAMLLVIAVAAALLVPAYTRDSPRHLNVVHEDKDGKAAFLLNDSGPVPAAMKAVADFGDRPDGDGNWRAPAPRLTDDGTFRVVSDITQEGVRTITTNAVSPKADYQVLHIANGQDLRSVEVNGTHPRIKGTPFYVGCTGRACRELTIVFRLPAGGRPPEITWERVRHGAGQAAGKLVAARPVTARAVHGGDSQRLISAVRLTENR